MANPNPFHLNLMIISSDDLLSEPLKELLLNSGYNVQIARDLKQVQELMKTDPYSLFICDQKLQEASYLEVIQLIQASQPESSRMLLADHLDIQTFLQALNVGRIHKFIQKPWNNAALLEAVMALTERYRMKKETQNLHKILEIQHQALMKNHEILRRELQIGARIHETLLLGKVPKEIEGFSFDVITVASQEIDGDFFEFYHPTKNIFDVVIGDVMGKGLPAALVGTAVKTQLMRFAVPYTQIQIYDGDWKDNLLLPQEIITRVDREITSQLIQIEYFVSLFYGRFNLPKRTLSYVDCGSTKPIHYRSALKKASQLVGFNYPLGTVENQGYQLIEVSYSKGDIFIFCSDGVTETKSPTNELFGIEPILKIIEDNPLAEPPAITQLIRSALIDFAKKTTFDDDITIIIIKVVETKDLEYKKDNFKSFQADMNETRKVRDFVVNECKKIGELDENQVYLLQLAINEAFCNICEHGYKGLKKGEIKIKCEITEDGIAFTLSDQGVSFDPASINKPYITEEETKGFGLLLIRKIADQITYVHKDTENGWNQMRIFKKIK